MAFFPGTGIDDGTGVRLAVMLWTTTTLTACLPDAFDRRPPEAAVRACTSLELGAPCGFEAEHGPVRGHCFVPPGEHAPACVPVRPPRAALVACEGRDAGDTCEFAAPHGPVLGVCDAPSGRPLACRPDHDHPRF